MLLSGPSIIQISQDQGEHSVVNICPKSTLDIVPDGHLQHPLQVLPLEIKSCLFGKVTFLVLKSALTSRGSNFKNFCPTVERKQVRVSL